jgi:excisionase family DNA binding protein
MIKKTMNIKEVADYLGISRSLAYKLANEGVIPVIRLGTRWIVPKQKLDEFLEK